MSRDLGDQVRRAFKEHLHLDVVFRPYSFNKGIEFNHASIELVASKRLIEPFIECLESKYRLEHGYKAKVVPIGLKDLGDKVSYNLDVVPIDGISRDMWRSATDELLTDLSHTVRNFAMRHKRR